jgi:hypothetical protein
MKYPPTDISQHILDMIWGAAEEPLIPNTEILDGKTLVLDPSDSITRQKIRTAVLQRISHIYLALCGNRFGRDRGDRKDRYPTPAEGKEKSTNFITYVMRNQKFRQSAPETHKELSDILEVIGFSKE